MCPLGKTALIMPYDEVHARRLNVYFKSAIKVREIKTAEEFCASITIFRTVRFRLLLTSLTSQEFTMINSA